MGLTQSFVSVCTPEPLFDLVQITSLFFIPVERNNTDTLADSGLQKMDWFYFCEGI